MNIFIALLMITSVILLFAGTLTTLRREAAKLSPAIGLKLLLVGSILGFTAIGASMTDWGKTEAAKSKLKRALKHQSSYSDKEIKNDTYYLKKAAEEMGLTSEDFNQIWWNCFESFAAELLSTEDNAEGVCRRVLNDAGITAREARAWLDKPVQRNAKVERIVREYWLSLPNKR